MRIISMTATFGKLDGQTIEFHDGLNIICAPNEWGKSTWCAFLTAMLYGIDTRARSTRETLAEKEKYMPWSGKPMEGSLRFVHEGKDITIQRRTKGRTPMGEFRAFETHTGLSVPGLTGENCGQLLLGVERSVFQRTGFIRFTDLPVEQDEALRRRLHALVTTGDESGSADLLARKLRELKNKCRYNRVGLIPEVREQIRDLSAQLQEREALQRQYEQLEQSIAETEAWMEQLEIHRGAMAYYQAREDRRRVEQAAEMAKAAQAKLDETEAKCADVPSRAELLGNLQQGQARVKTLENTESEPGLSRVPEVFLWILASLALVGGGIFWMYAAPELTAGAGILALVLAAAALIHGIRRWNRDSAREAAEQARQQELDELEEKMDRWHGQIALLEDLDRARREAEQTRIQLQAMLSMARDAAKPEVPDDLTLSREETMTEIGRAAEELRRLRVSLGQCQGRMEHLPDGGLLRDRLELTRLRLERLEKTYRALDYAQKALEAAMQELQRRFAPRITRRAGQFLSRLTGGRYDRISIGDDLDIQAAREEETTLRTAQWRSEGTGDQMYLALRLAVWEALAPGAPLVLDDALIRFDRQRLGYAMDLLTELAGERQVLMFSCQERESFN